VNAARSGARVAVEGLVKCFDHGRVRAVDGLSMTVDPGEIVAVTGRSGSGKSTLLNLLGGLDRPDAGRILVDGRRLWDRGDMTEYRASTVGFIFQFHHLLPTLTAASNVEVAMLGRGLPRRERARRAEALLIEVGLAGRMQSLPATLSGGERQRVAIARALANGPRLLLADEPTGSLDWATGAGVLALLMRLRAERGMTAIIVTNDAEVAASADRSLRMSDGRLGPLNPDGARPAAQA
jgi:putative ABC transport system ATP-binding protein